MVEPAGKTARRTVADGPTGLLATKLYLPRAPRRFVPRPRLADRLDKGLDHELTLVSAPAGFGKTALLGEWCRRLQRPVGWLSLDAGDNDPVRFWRHVVAALDRVRPGIAEQIDPLLGSSTPSALEGVTTAIVNHLVGEPEGEVVLVLDDYHLIDAEPVHSSLLFLLEHAAEGIHVVVASRVDPQLSLARLRARGQLSELRAADLRFTTGEAAILLHQLVTTDSADDAVARLTARTEGWVAGLQLAALSLQGRQDAARFVESFSGSHRFILDYLSEEILEQQPEQLREFLLETSILGGLSGPLCDAVTGRTGSQRVLEEIEAANLFLVPLDVVRGWWRYHHLFADLLRARLRQQRPERFTELHRHAATWHHEHGDADDAVRHALAAGDSLWAARLAEAYAEEFLMRSETGTLQRWIAALPPELVASRPRLLIAEQSIALQAGDVERVQELLDAAERAAADVADEPYEPSTGLAASALANIAAVIGVHRAWLAYLRGDAEAATAFGERARAELDAGEWKLELVTRWHLGVATWLGGRLTDAERWLAGCAVELARAKETTLSSVISLDRGQMQCAQGRLDAAIRTYRDAVRLTAPPDGPALPAAGIAYIGLAEIAYQRNDLDAALHDVTEGIRLCRHLTHNLPLAVGLATLARIRQADGDPVGARDAIDEAARVGPNPRVTSLLNPVPALRARLLLAQGEVDAAAQVVAERGIGSEDEPRYPEEAAYLVLARVLLAQNRPQQAVGLLDRLHTLAASHNRDGSMIEIQALRALALAASGDDAAAMDTLTTTLTLAHPHGYVRVFVDEGPPMAALLGQLIATQQAERAGVPVRYLGLLVRAFEQPTGDASLDAQAAPVITAGLVTQLTDRELEILRLLAAGKANQQIAAELFVSLNTVKKHVTHILDKLGATNRTEATARARELGLLE